MPEPRETDTLAATGPTLCLVGHPGAFLDWGTAVIGEALARAGHAVRVEPLEQADPRPAAPGEARLLRATGPALSRPEPTLPAARTIVLLEDPARALREAIVATADPGDAVRQLSTLLAPLAGLRRTREMTLIERPADGDPAQLRRRIVEAAVPGLEAGDGGADLALVPPPPLGPVGRALLRQTVRPLHDIATGAGTGPIVLPLALFYGTEPLGEQPPPLSAAAGPSRAVYYGPYMHMPAGAWRIEAECYFSQELCNTQIAVDVATDAVLARAEFEPPAEGYFKVVFRVVVPSAQERLEVRLWLVRGMIGGLIGLRQVTWHHEGMAR